MTEIKNLKQKLERNKEFSVIEVIEQLEKENAELKAEIEKLNKRNQTVQKICFDSCL